MGGSSGSRFMKEASMKVDKCKDCPWRAPDTCKNCAKEGK